LLFAEACAAAEIGVGATMGLVEVWPVDMVTGDPDDAGAAVGLRTRWMVDPSVISYSFNNFVSANALPLSRRRWVSTGGAVDDDAATRDLSSEMGSVSEAEMGNVREGLRDLTMRLILSGWAGECNQLLCSRH
jgi:hypothetical protein